MKQHILESIENHPWEWISGAAIFGWLLSRLTARKMGVSIDSTSQRPVKNRADGPLRKLWREAWKISKPLIAAYVSKLIAEQDKVRESK
jgi:hypothetical protein